MARSYPLAGGGSFELDEDGVGEILRSSQMVGIVREAANAVAVEAGLRGASQVWVDHYQTDRAAASVTIPYSPDSELKYGILIDAATAAGLDVREA